MPSFAFNLRPPAGGLVLHALIFANGDLQVPGDLRERVAGADLIIAADGGARHCRSLGLSPHVLIGDLDSIEPQLRVQLETQGVRLIQHPAQKDQTDFELALLHAKEAGAQKVIVLGGLGRRWDQSLANLLLAADIRFTGMHLIYLYGEQQLFVLRGENKLDAKRGERVSLLPLAGDAKGVASVGLEYPLKDETLALGSSRGVSNKALIDFPEINIEDGVLLCIVSPFELE